MIVLALIALGWWLAAPDRFTAAARTASGTGLRAAGTGAKAHWNGGRDGRALGRTKRRDRWHAKGGWWRKLLGLEHGAVVTGKAVKSAGKLAGAAVKPVPGAVRDGWRKGQDRHRARTAGRPVPVALDPPWWRKPDPAPVLDGAGQDSPQDGGTTSEDSPQDGGTTSEDSPQDGGTTSEDSPTGQPEESPVAATVLGEKGGHCSRCLSPVGRYWAECPTCQATLAGLMTANGTYLPSADTTVERIPPAGRIPTDPEGLGELIRQLPTGRDEYGEPYIDDVILLDRLSQQEGDAAAGIWRRAVTPADTPTGADPDATTIPATTPGGTVPPISTELRTHVAVQDFAHQIDRISEASDFIVVAEKAREVGKQSRAGGFGGEMDLAVDSLEAAAKRFAQDVDTLREQAHALTKTSLSVQGA